MSVCPSSLVARRVWAILRLAGKKLFQIDGAQWASAFAFNAFFSLLPLILLLVTLASLFVDRDRAANEVSAYLQIHVPLSGEMQRQIGVWWDHGFAAVDLCLRLHFHFRRLPVRWPGRSA